MTSPLERPDCAGWHEPDPICDGDGAREPACAYRAHCLKVIELAGGESRTAQTIARILESHTDAQLIPASPPTSPPTGVEAAEADEALPKEPEAPTSPPTAASGATTFPPIHTTEGGRVRTARDIHPRPSPRYDHVLPLVDTFTSRFAREVGRTLRQEGDPETKPGDIFIRWTPGMQGRAANLYEATDRGTRRHRLITRIVMLVRDARFNLKTNVPDEQYSAALSLKPPAGPDCRVWTDVKPHVALVGVDAHAARDAARWLGRCFKLDLIDNVKRKAPKAKSRPAKKGGAS